MQSILSMFSILFLYGFYMPYVLFYKQNCSKMVHKTVISRDFVATVDV